MFQGLSDNLKNMTMTQRAPQRKKFVLGQKSKHVKTQKGKAKTPKPTLQSALKSAAKSVAKVLGKSALKTKKN